MAGRLLVAILLLPVLAGSGYAQEKKKEEQVALDAEGPKELLERGRKAFFANDFVTAEEALEKFIVDYGEAEEVKEAVRIHTPFVAICKVGNRKFADALIWIEKSLADPKIEFKMRDELSFWKGICQMTQGDLVDAQHAFGAYWANEKHQPFKRYEALLLFATLYIQQDFPEESADFLESQLPKFRDVAPEAASRAVVLQLYARIAAKQNDKALALVRAEYPDMSKMTQAISFQTMAMQLGSSFLEEKNWYNAIACLQRIWTKEKLLEHQNGKISMIKERIEMLQQRPNSQSVVFQLNSVLKRVERELAGFEKIENFDSALRLRLASAFQGLGRFREAALIMEGMLDSMPPDPIVESATLVQLQCWMAIKRWPKAIKTAEKYEAVFGQEGKSLPTVLFLKADAYRESHDFGKAQLAYGRIVEKFPDDTFSPKAVFMQGFMYLQQDDNEGALFQFDQLKRNYPKSGMLEDADYWSGMAMSFSKDYAEAREHMQGYLKRHKKNPKYKKEAVFRIAVCTFSLAEYVESIPLFERFNSTYLGDPLCDESNLLMGDAWLGEGEMEKGFAAYDAVRPESRRFFEEAWFKKGKAYKLLEEFDTMRAHFEKFIAVNPKSNRMPEAVYWVGWTHLNDEKPEQAKKMYWDTIGKFGNKPEMFSMADVFSALPKVYKNEGESGREDLLVQLENTKTRAEAKDQKTLALRAAWAKSELLAKTSPAVSRAELLAAAKWIDPKEQNPLLTVASAEALLDAGNILTAKEALTNIRKWHPRAVQKDRIYAALGRIADEQGETAEAIRFYEKFEKETATSIRLGEVLVAKAKLQEKIGKDSDARKTLESILEQKYISASQKANTLFELGHSYAKSGDYTKAVVFYERIYVAYGKFGEVNAKAYWERGGALEKLDLQREALETYQELAAREDLKKFDEAKKAVKKIEELARIVPPEPVREENGEEKREAQL